MKEIGQEEVETNERTHARTVIMFLQQCVAINDFVTMFLYIICNNVLVTGYVLLAFGEIA